MEVETYLFWSWWALCYHGLSLLRLPLSLLYLSNLRTNISEFCIICLRNYKYLKLCNKIRFKKMLFFFRLVIPRGTKNDIFCIVASRLKQPVVHCMIRRQPLLVKSLHLSGKYFNMHSCGCSSYKVKLGLCGQHFYSQTGVIQQIKYTRAMFPGPEHVIATHQLHRWELRQSWHSFVAIDLKIWGEHEQ